MKIFGFFRFHAISRGELVFPRGELVFSRILTQSHAGVFCFFLV